MPRYAAASPWRHVGVEGVEVEDQRRRIDQQPRAGLTDEALIVGEAFPAHPVASSLGHHAPAMATPSQYSRSVAGDPLAHQIDVVEPALAAARARPRRPPHRGAALPRSARPMRLGRRRRSPRGSPPSAACRGTGTSTSSSSRSKAGPSTQRTCTSLRDHVGQEALEHRRATSKSNEPMPWPMSKITPRSRAARISRAGPVRRRHRRVRKRPEAVGQHVARAQPAQHLLARRRRLVDMRHHRHAQLAPRPRARCRAAPRRRRSADVATDPDLDADDQVALCSRRRHASRGVAAGGCRGIRRPSRFARSRRCRRTRC